MSFCKGFRIHVEYLIEVCREDRVNHIDQGGRCYQYDVWWYIIEVITDHPNTFRPESERDVGVPGGDVQEICEMYPVHDLTMRREPECPVAREAREVRNMGVREYFP